MLKWGLFDKGFLFIYLFFLIWTYPVLDHIFEQILYSSEPELSEARAILNNIVCRRLYKCVGQTTPETHVDASQVSGLRDSDF